MGPFFWCFWQNFYWRALAPWTPLCSEKFQVVCLHPGIIIFVKCSISNAWYTCLDNCPVVFKVTLCYELQTHSDFWHIPNSVYLGMCRYILYAHSALLRHIYIYWSIIKNIPTYSVIVSKHIVWPLHIHNVAIFWALAYLGPDRYSQPYEILTRHIQNPVIVQNLV